MLMIKFGLLVFFSFVLSVSFTGFSSIDPGYVQTGVGDKVRGRFVTRTFDDRMTHYLG